MVVEKIKIMLISHLKTLFIYKFDFVSSLLSVIIPIAGLTLFWSKTPAENIRGTSFNSDNIIFYYLVVMLIEFLMSSDLAFSVEEDVMFGRLNNYIMLPFSYFQAKCIEYFVHIIFPLILLLLVSLLLFVSFDFSFVSICYCLCLVTVGMILNFYLMMSVGLLTVWLQKINGLIYFLDTLIGLLSGAVIPISCYPSWLKWISWNPFALAVSFPTEIMLFGNIQIFNILVLLVWVLFFYILSKFLWVKAVRDYSAYGG